LRSLTTLCSVAFDTHRSTSFDLVRPRSTSLVHIALLVRHRSTPRGTSGAPMLDVLEPPTWIAKHSTRSARAAAATGPPLRRQEGDDREEGPRRREGRELT